MIRHVWSVLCHQAFIDVDSNAMALSVLEVIGFSRRARTETEDGSPVVLPIPCQLMTLWHSEDPGVRTFDYVVALVAPNGQVLNESPVHAELRQGHQRLRSRLQFPGLAYVGPGTYFFRVLRDVDGRQVVDAEVPLSISEETAERKAE